MSAVRVALVGTRGFGRVHFQGLQKQISEGLAELVGVVDVAEPEADVTAPWFLTLGELLEQLPGERAPEVVIIATPITTHMAMALEALAAGCHVLLEKPPVRSLAEHWQLLRAAREAGRSVQVGFQARGGGGIDRLRRIVRGGELGRVLRVTAYGAWQRDRAYYSRSRWAGLRRLGGERVADGVATNPLAHGVHAALTVAGIDRADQIAEVTTELRRAHDIEADDTTYLGILPAQADLPPVHCALVTTAPDQSDPWVEVVAERGRARLYYTADRAEIGPAQVVPSQIVPAGVAAADIGAAARREDYERISLVENLLRHVRDASVPLLCPLESTSAFTAVLDATQSVPDPTPIGPEHVTWVGEGPAAHPVVEDVEAWMTAALDSGAPFAEVGAPWGDASAVHRWSPRRVLRTQEIAGSEIAVLVDGSDIIPRSSPRPYLHPLRTLGGTVITDAHPADHDWHNGLGVVIQDVADVNFWGGRTYVEGAGYIWREDHGTIAHEAFEETSADGTAWTQRLRWRGPEPAADASAADVSAADASGGSAPSDGPGPRVELEETRTHVFAPVEGGWSVELTSQLRPVSAEAMELGSPGSHGREGGGYGGLFLRLAPLAEATVAVPGPDGGRLTGEDAVHGARAPWVELCGTAATGGRFAVRIEHLDEHDDPWFVRVAGYPGLGSAIAWDSPVTTTAEQPLTRAFRITVRDLP
ncbi:oxidoreductase [Brachybacterium phenoliresistens]|uniref:Oxidoreductase n=1 Tax=Brachybacterium phenoliresistens TaxID=396014 RepID=Z9JWE9_9MICO|nr:DUF6807 family protein [Brachybacterium phenoliresistens]EWS82087.1 oxidoreductase [Brachybacterium phenoliresistens]